MRLWVVGGALLLGLTLIPVSVQQSARDGVTLGVDYANAITYRRARVTTRRAYRRGYRRAAYGAGYYGGCRC